MQEALSAKAFGQKPSVQKPRGHARGRKFRSGARPSASLHRDRLNNVQPGEEQPGVGIVDLKAMYLRFRMDDFANASFQPDLVALMDTALSNAVSKLPHPVSSAHVNAIAQTILRTAKEGERNVVALETMALLELQLSP
jgi:hypothetical protein